MSAIPSGVINIIKPPGPTSQDVVTDVKRTLQVKKVGHTGTLDPGAAGVLPICVGKATRLFDYLVDKDKRYRFEIQLGMATDTLDSYGALLEKQAIRRYAADEVQVAIAALIGRQTQLPPLYSAVKLDGQSLHRLARKGQDAAAESQIRQKKAREIEVYDFQLVEETAENRFLLEAHCSKGTYVRVLAEEVARRLGTIAVVSFLLRTQTGAYALEDAISLDELRECAQDGSANVHIQPLDEALAFYPAIDVPGAQYQKLRNGNAVAFAGDGESGLCRVYCRGEFFGMGTVEQGALSLRSMLWEPGGISEK